MRIGEFLSPALVVPELGAADKEGAIRELASHLCIHTTDVRAPAELVAHALLERERLGSTGVGEGVAIPHAKITGLGRLVACLGRARKGIAFEAIDGRPVSLIFVLLVPDNSAGAHLKALARISRLLKNPDFRARLLAIEGQEALYQAFIAEDEKY